MALGFKEVAEIIQIIDASNCDEVVLEVEGTRLEVRRGETHHKSRHSTPGEPPAQTTAHSRKQEPVSRESSISATVEKSDETLKGVSVCSPMVGTFYRRASPEDAPFVEQGSKVSAGDPLCMIEVMKLFTTIESSVSGIVDSILAEDSKLVGFDQPLFIIRPE